MEKLSNTAQSNTCQSLKMLVPSSRCLGEDVLKIRRVFSDCTCRNDFQVRLIAEFCT